MPPSNTSIQVPFMDLSRHHRPLAEELRDAFERVLGASAFILGQEVERFEAEFAAFCGTRHCIGVGSGTAALTIMLRAAEIGAGQEVIVPGHTFLATALSVEHAGAVPICVDVDLQTGLIDSTAVAAAIGDRTAAILPVHLYGQACQMDALRTLADRYGLALFEDAAQAHGATYRGRRAGSLGDAAAFSFYPSKNLGALGDGGAVCTDNDELAQRARRYRDLGRADDSSHALPGYNERLDGLQAAFLRVKLEHLESWNEARREAAAFYRERLPGLTCLDEAADSPCVYHLFPVRVENRDHVATRLASAGIVTGVHYPLTLAEQPSLPGLAGAEIPAARDWARRELSLPIFPEITEQELEAVASAVADVIVP
jgi:dTDP-3-amino-3,4,6-trideoxy-alpha-D-glucose transaminase